MDFRIWSYSDQTALDNLENHLEHWQQFLDAYERLVVSSSNPKPLQASLRRHLALSVHTIALLEQQRLLLLHLQQHQSKVASPFSGTSGDLVGE